MPLTTVGQAKLSYCSLGKTSIQGQVFKSRLGRKTLMRCASQLSVIIKVGFSPGVNRGRAPHDHLKERSLACRASHYTPSFAPLLSLSQSGNIAQKRQDLEQALTCGC